MIFLTLLSLLTERQDIFGFYTPILASNQPILAGCMFKITLVCLTGTNDFWFG